MVHVVTLKSYILQSVVIPIGLPRPDTILLVGGEITRKKNKTVLFLNKIWNVKMYLWTLSDRE